MKFKIWFSKFLQFKLWKINKKIILLVMIILLGAWGYTSGYYNNNWLDKSAKNEVDLSNFKTVKVVKDNINQTIKVVGTAELVDEQTLRFNQIGKINNVYFQNGETVKKDEIIAELDKTEVLNEISQAQISLQNSKITLQELINGDNDVAILKAENNILETNQKIKMAKKNLIILRQDEKNVLSNLENEIITAEKDVNDKNQSLANAKKDLENTLVFENEDLSLTNNNYQATIKDALLEIKNTIIETDNIMAKLDAVLCLEPGTKSNNDEFESYLGALNSNTKTQAENTYKNSQTKYQKVVNEYESLSNQENLNIEVIINLLNLSQDLLITIMESADYTYSMLENTITGNSLTTNTLDSYKSSVASTRSSGQNKLSSLKNMIDNLNNLEDLSISELHSNDTIRQKEESIRNIELALDKAEDALQTLKNDLTVKQASKKLEYTNKENELVVLQENLNTQEEELAKLKRGETAERIKMAQNDILQRELAVAKVQKNVEKYELMAPFDGILRKIDFKTGDNLLADEDKFVYIENPDLLKITVLLDQIDIVNVKLGDKAEIIFDALPNKTFIGEIGEIDQTPVVQSGVVSYEASITLNKEKETIFSGMTATVEIITEEKDNVLLVPSLSVTTKKKKAYVQKIVNNKPIETEVITGITNGKYTEIISGLEVDDEIVEIDFNANTTDKTNGQDTMRQMMRATGGGPPH